MVLFMFVTFDKVLLIHFQIGRLIAVDVAIWDQEEYVIWK